MKDSTEKLWEESVQILQPVQTGWIGYSAGSGPGSSEKENRKMKTELENVLPQDIEKRSFEIITEELGEVSLIPGTEPIVKRCIHTSADFEYAKSLKFSENAVQRAMDAIRDGSVDRDRYADGKIRDQQEKTGTVRRRSVLFYV